MWILRTFYNDFFFSVAHMFYSSIVIMLFQMCISSIIKQSTNDFIFILLTNDVVDGNSSRYTNR